jgi:predicted AAA+ superfamily ATPase
MFGMSFREYLELHHGYDFDTYKLQALLFDHQTITESIITLLETKAQRILPLFKEYLRVGYYPYFLGMQNESMFFQTLRQNINVSIEGDLLSIYPTLNGNSIKKLKKLLAIIMQSVPFTPKMSELKKVIEVKDDRTLKEYLSKLDDAGLIQLLMKSSLSMKALDKPEKIYVTNTNLLYVGDPEVGTVRETFFLNQLHNYYGIKDLFQDSGIYAADQGDFYLEEKYTFEVGGKNKSFKQIKNVPLSYIAADEIEIGYGNKIPLWLFGFLY